MKFEDDYKRLGEIADSLEVGNIGLDESVKLFEEACECRKRLLDELNRQKGRLTLIKQESDKYVETEQE